MPPLSWRWVWRRVENLQESQWQPLMSCYTDDTALYLEGRGTSCFPAESSFALRRRSTKLLRTTSATSISEVHLSAHLHFFRFTCLNFDICACRRQGFPLHLLFKARAFSLRLWSKHKLEQQVCCHLCVRGHATPDALFLNKPISSFSLLVSVLSIVLSCWDFEQI